MIKALIIITKTIFVIKKDKQKTKRLILTTQIGLKKKWKK